MIPMSRGRGGRSMIPGSAGSRPSASAGSVSVPRSIARICSAVSGSGIAPARERVEQERHHLGRGVGEDVGDELADVVVDHAALLDRGHDRGEVVVGEHHRRRLARHVGAGRAHGDRRCPRGAAPARRSRRRRSSRPCGPSARSASTICSFVSGDAASDDQLAALVAQELVRPLSGSASISGRSRPGRARRRSRPRGRPPRR